MKNMVSTLHSITIFTVTIFLKKMVIVKMALKIKRCYLLLSRVQVGHVKHASMSVSLLGAVELSEGQSQSCKM